ncbi:MAG: hypothetical protein MR809_09760 [Rikenellaceae bacterium]|nr:hypothetical protein [Rikenellaceae bacterium]MDY4916322.1 hypothetical protein [Candidatus Cryptobacteroides sp.]
MNKTVKLLVTGILLPVVIILLAVVTVQSVMEPIKFNKAKDAREKVAIQQLKDIRDLQVAFKSVNGRYTSSFDTLITFYKSGKMKVVMKVGSMDDSLAVVNTKALKKKNPKITAEQMLELVAQGQRLVFTTESEIPVSDTLFTNRDNFNVDVIGVIPFSEGQPVEMESTIRMVSGVQVPLFEAAMPYKALLKGLDNQLRINLDDDRIKSDRYPGLKVGSVSAPNNNAGNWE